MIISILNLEFLYLFNGVDVFNQRCDQNRAGLKQNLEKKTQCTIQRVLCFSVPDHPRTSSNSHKLAVKGRLALLQGSPIQPNRRCGAGSLTKGYEFFYNLHDSECPFNVRPGGPLTVCKWPSEYKTFSSRESATRKNVRHAAPTILSFSLLSRAFTELKTLFQCFQSVP